jgi:hypothetical protein
MKNVLLLGRRESSFLEKPPVILKSTDTTNDVVSDGRIDECVVPITTPGPIEIYCFHLVTSSSDSCMFLCILYWPMPTTIPFADSPMSSATQPNEPIKDFEHVFNRDCMASKARSQTKTMDSVM